MDNTASQWWFYFIEGYDQGSRAPAIACKFCAHIFQHPRAGAKKSAPTSVMKAHIEVKCEQVRRETSQAVGTANAPLSMFFPEAQKEWTQNDVNEQILKFFISGNIPFNQANNPEFQKLIRMIKVGKSSAKPPSRKTIRRCLHDHAIVAVKQPRETLQSHKERISLALDCWSTRNMLPFLGNAPL